MNKVSLKRGLQGHYKENRAQVGEVIGAFLMVRRGMTLKSLKQNVGQMVGRNSVIMREQLFYGTTYLSIGAGEVLKLY